MFFAVVPALHRVRTPARGVPLASYSAAPGGVPVLARPRGAVRSHRGDDVAQCDLSDSQCVII